MSILFSLFSLSFNHVSYHVKIRFIIHILENNYRTIMFITDFQRISLITNRY